MSPPRRNRRFRIWINLHRVWPRWLGLLVAAAVTAAVVALAWQVGGDEPVPPWVSDRLVPLLGWSAIVLLAVGLALRFVTRRRR